MDFHKIDGLTLQELYDTVMQSPIGFSVEDDSIQYLGRQIRLHNGITELTGQTCNNADGKELFKRLVNLQPDIKRQLPDSKAEAIQHVAKEMVEKFRYEAIEKSPNKEVLFAVFVESIIFTFMCSIKTAKKLYATNAFSDAEKLRIMLAAEKKYRHPILANCWEMPGIPLAPRLEEAKSQLQRLSDTPSMAGQYHVINERLTTLPTSTTVRDGLLEIRQTLESENNELARQLLSEVDHIEAKFIPKIDESGRLSDVDDKDFKTHTRRLLYLYAACSGFSQKADIEELASYIRSALHTTDSNSIWHIVKELAYLSKQPGSIDYCRYVDAVANILTAPETNIVSDFEELKQLSDINGFALLESQKTLDPYLQALRANIDNMTPEYSQALLPAVKYLESQFAAISLPEQKPNIKVEVHRLLIINFSNFSEETRNKLLSRGETLELTEDPWDLFISGLEVKTCQSPEGPPCVNSALMSYVMDGRNAMIVRKNQKGTILSRSVIRMVLDQDDCPVLFLEMGYPDRSHLLFIDAAREIANAMELPLYHCVDSRKGEKVKLLEGRAPYDMFDAIEESVGRNKFTFTNVQRDVSQPS
ncbi:hypothetical protein [Endozoicomonas acroporae]|uniref:hypothetical protein n=1 Tax=Endozoicomonas acroporae TaxID=1701104 RepID=UPI003D78F79F